MTTKANATTAPITTVSPTIDVIRLARALVEDKFLALGQGLESAVEIHSRLTETFRDLLADFESDSLKQAVDDITSTASRVENLAAAYDAEHEALAEITAASRSIDECVSRMRAAIKTVDVLGISAKIEAMHLGDQGADFTSFAEEIASSLKLAQTNLAKLTREIAGVRGHLAKANAGDADFAVKHGESLRQIPARLKVSVESLSAHHARAIEATSTVAELSKRIVTRIGAAVMALQIGDITRQRIEHVEQGLEILEGIARSEPGNEDAAQTEWQQLSMAERQRLIALGCELQAAQLSDTVKEFDDEVLRIIDSLKELSHSASDIVHLGAQAYGGSGGVQDSFLFDLEEDVHHARALLAGFRAAREGADEVVAAVRDAASRLIDQVGMIQSLEADVRIVGLNTSFKCGRLGPAGRPLSIIAQELRACSKITANEADIVMDALDHIMHGVSALSGQDLNRREVEIGSVAKLMTESVNQLGGAARNLTFALGTLNEDSGTVTGLLDGTIRQSAVHEEIGAVLHQAAADLAKRGEEAGQAGQPARQSESVETAKEGLLALFGASYTMAQERTVHGRIAGQSAENEEVAAGSNSDESDASLDDFLF